MDEFLKIYCKDRNEWRSWLQDNFFLSKSIWLVYFKKHTNKLSISYKEAVEEAICFGWIDGRIKKIDEDRYMQYFSPRTAKSRWSEINIERANQMIKEGLMTKLGLEIFQNGLKREKVPSSRKFSVPPDLQTALSNNKKALKNFRKFPPSAQLAYVYWISTAKKDETRGSRIRKTVELISQNKRYGDK